MPPRFIDGKELSETELCVVPQPMAFDCLLGDAVLLAGGAILNPFGPTLEVIAAIGKWGMGANLPVVRAMLNPFSQEIARVGECRIRDLFNPTELITAFLPACQGGCPTALLLSPLLHQRPNEALATSVAYLLQHDFVADTLASVRLFPGKPRDRVKNEVDRGMKAMLAERRGEPTVLPEPHVPTEAEVLAVVESQIRRSNLVAEWQCFILCWLQAIESQKQTGLARAAMPFGTVEPLVSTWVADSISVAEIMFP